jgi:hypothetical protein
LQIGRDTAIEASHPELFSEFIFYVLNGGLEITVSGEKNYTVVFLLNCEFDE